MNSKIFVITIGAVCGDRYSKFGSEWGLPLSRLSPDLSNPRKITTIGARTRRHAPVRATARKLQAPPCAAVPKVSETHSFRHRIEQWIPPSGSSSPDLKNGVKNGLIGAATRRWKLRRPLPRPAHASACRARASTRQHTPGTPRQPTRSGSELIQTGSEPGPSRTRTKPSRSEPEPSQDRARPDPNRLPKKKKKQKNSRKL